jgi:hypothetical protein
MFTIHAGEYLVGLHVQQRLGLTVWIPAKDIGIDLLVTDGENHRTVSLQAKYGKDFLPGKSATLRESLRCLSWFTLNRAKLKDSPAEFWVFVLHSFKSGPDFVVIPKAELQQRMTKLHKNGTLQIYLCSTGSNFCWETRGLGNNVMLQIAKGTYKNTDRDFTEYLNENGWAALRKKLTA